MIIFDISRPLANRTAVWPGDVPFDLEWTELRSRGAAVNLSSMRGSPHVGTHADAPNHVVEGGLSIDQVELAAYLGPARVVEVSVAADGLIHPSMWLPVVSAGGAGGAEPAQSTPPRVLFRTGSDPDPFRRPARFASFSPDTAHALVALGLVLVGIDTPSVDPADSEELPAHHILAAGGLRWLENLDLAGVASGDYELIALPLRIVGGEASPVRAVLVRR